ncbi:hypothetical protein BV25DRAFT_1873329 [Artomyces pyxidatus]|uniref:Uncharacterized protein n=1 Tax=Artomyces pyxidatus TaxID=48021 RepID=A0ACB8SFA8_9AGAM|nr:hypothetical protein BV25DRAFT_1873329 [Artomyces pyxidatus]
MCMSSLVGCNPSFADRIWHACDFKTRFCHCLGTLQHDICLRTRQTQRGRRITSRHGDCDHLQPQNRKNGLKLLLQPITLAEVHTALKKITDPDIQPLWMILTVISIPPSTATDGGAMRGVDALTYKLRETIKASTNVRKSEPEGSSAHILIEH